MIAALFVTVAVMQTPPGRDDRIIATVRGREIRHYEIASASKSGTVHKLEQENLNVIIVDELLAEGAERLEISVSEADIDGVFASLHFDHQFFMRADDTADRMATALHRICDGESPRKIYAEFVASTTPRPPDGGADNEEAFLEFASLIRSHDGIEAIRKSLGSESLRKSIKDGVRRRLLRDRIAERLKLDGVNARTFWTAVIADTKPTMIDRSFHLVALEDLP